MFKIQVLEVREENRELSADWSQKLPVPGGGIVVYWRNGSHFPGTSKMQSSGRPIKQSENKRGTCCIMGRVGLFMPIYGCLNFH